MSGLELNQLRKTLVVHFQEFQGTEGLDLVNLKDLGNTFCSYL